ncbi:MAG TPA: bifunctional nuclease family protein [Acidimicrobiales bacterium]|nr:bifunctional nuclease family protein [Acidimicrobiales bacterium]
MTAGKRFKRLVRQRAARTGESYVSARRALLAKRTEPSMELVEVTVELVGTQVPNPFVLLREREGERQVVVFVGAAEANAIGFGLRGVEMRRPMTHDALKQVVDALGGRLARIVLGFDPPSTFTADVTIALAGGDERHLDWRPSDSIALAVRCTPAPAILVPPELFSRSPVGAALAFPCRACGAVIAVTEADLTPVPEAPQLAQAHVECPACGNRQAATLVRRAP